MKREDLDVLWILTVSALVVLLMLALLGIAVLHAQTLVSIDRAGYDTGLQHIECWLVPGPAAAAYATGVLVVDCRSDRDGVFRNGFDGGVA